MRLLFVFSVMLIVLAGCTPAVVNLTVRNTMPYERSVKTIIYDDENREQAQVSYGVLAGKTSAVQSFEVEQGGAYRVLANVPSSARVFDSQSISVTGAQKVLNRELSIADSALTLDDAESMNSVMQSFSEIKGHVGIQPTDLGGALRTVFGSLVVVEKDETTGLVRVLRRITPEELGVSVTSLGDLRYPGTNRSSEVNISGKSVLKASTSLPMFAAFGFEWNNSSVYKVSWSMSGFGWVYKTEDAGKGYLTQYWKLPREVTDDVSRLLRTHTGAKAYYINQMFVMNSGRMERYEGSALSASSTANAADVVTASGAYTFESSIRNVATLNNTAMAFKGDEVQLYRDLQNEREQVVLDAKSLEEAPTPGEVAPSEEDSAPAPDAGSPEVDPEPTDATPLEETPAPEGGGQ
ncbi:MAG: hypothetical protein AB7D51_00975 [Desulfovibrionaceae bacterium]